MKIKTNRPRRFATRVKKGRVIPFGYRQDEFDKRLLQPIPHQLLALEQAMVYLKSCSYSQVAKWLTAKSGRYISEIGLWKMKKKYKDNMYDKHYQLRLKRDKLARKYAREQLTAAKVQEENEGGSIPDSLGEATASTS